MRIKASGLSAAAWILVCCAAAMADEQRFQERLLQPNLEAASPIQNMTFQGTGGFDIKAFETRAFAGQRAFETPAYDAPRFLGLRIPWFANREAAVETSPMQQRTFAQALQAFQQAHLADERDRRAARTREDRDNERAYRTRQATVEGASQRTLTDYSNKLREGMTVEEVREFLNRAP